MNKFIPIAEPLFEGNELKYLTDCIETGWISSIGSYVTRFENEFASYIGCKYGAAVHTGTAALHLALAALGVGPGDEVIVPDLTFAATANAVLYTGARPVPVDVEKDTWNIGPEAIQQAITARTKAVIPVHLYGHPCDMDAIIEVAHKHDLLVIEDAAEAHGAEYKGKRVGNLGTISCFSFFGNKTITTGEGGMCLCNDESLIKRIAKLRDHGMSKDKKYWHDEVGFNYRMTNLQAAVGVAQLERIAWFVDRKREIAGFYNHLLADMESIVLPVEKKWAKNTYWMYTILLKRDPNRISRDDLMDALRREGIESRPVFYPLNRMPPYKVSGSFVNAEAISEGGLSLPSSPTLGEKEVRRIAEAIKRKVEGH